MPRQIYTITEFDGQYPIINVIPEQKVCYTIR